MPEFDTQTIIARDQALQTQLGDILRDKNRYESEEFAQCIRQKQELSALAGRLGVRGQMEEARRKAYEEARTAIIVDLAA